MSHCVRPTTDTHRSVAVAQGRPHTMPNPLAFVGGGAALTAAARAADKANGGGGPFRRLGEGRGAALREAWPVEALHTVPAARRAAAGDAEELFAHARPPTSKAKREAGERRAVQHQEWADAPKVQREEAESGGGADNCYARAHPLGRTTAMRFQTRSLRARVPRDSRVRSVLSQHRGAWRSEP